MPYTYRISKLGQIKINKTIKNQLTQIVYLNTNLMRIADTLQFNKEMKRIKLKQEEKLI